MNVNPYVPCELHPDFHAVYSISLAELIEGGLDFSTPEWDFDSYSDGQRADFWHKFEQYYYWREIGVLPFRRWRQTLLAQLNLIMPKYKALYKALEDAPDLLTMGDEFEKQRHIYSDFPQTMIGGLNQDYASSGNDRERELLRQYGLVDAMDAWERYRDPTMMLVLEFEHLFASLLTVNINGF